MVVCAPVLVAAIAAASCNPSPAADAEPETIIPVTVEPVQLGTIRGIVSATGIVATLPGAEFAIMAPRPGRIAEITKAVGDTVKGGEPLVRFEFPSLRAESTARETAVRAADQRARNAKLIQGRIHSLFDRGAAARTEVSEADREVEAAETELSEARASQSATEAQGRNTTIVAPFNGVVTERLHNPGDVVDPGDNDAILRIIDPRQVQLIATVGLADVTRFAVGTSARAVAAGNAAQDLLRVASRPEAERGATTVPVSLTFDSPTELAPGTQVGVEIDAEQRSNVVLVPPIAIVRDTGNTAAVFVAIGNIANRRPVETGLVDAEHIEIRSGLKPGEMVITQGLANLRDGSAITVGR